MKDLHALSDRELLILIADRQKRIDKRISDVEVLVTKHEKFRNTLIGAITTSLVTSIASFIGYLKTIAG